jgi:hypothetical protein
MDISRKDIPELAPLPYVSVTDLKHLASYNWMEETDTYDRCSRPSTIVAWGQHTSSAEERQWSRLRRSKCSSPPGKPYSSILRGIASRFQNSACRQKVVPRKRVAIQIWSRLHSCCLNKTRRDATLAKIRREIS